MSGSSATLVPMFTKELELCRLRAGETVGIFTEGGVYADFAEAFAVAAGELGASSVVHVDLPLETGRDAGYIGGRAAGVGLAANPVAVDAFKACDLLIDHTLLLWTPEQHAIKEAGTRILSCVAPADALARLFPNDDIRRRCREAADLLQSASTLHLANDAGTDLTYEFGEFFAFCQYGIADEPGRWDNFASALAVRAPASVNGTLVLQPGDVLFPWQRFCEEPVRMEIRGGMVTSIDGGLDAWLVSSMMASFDDPRAYAVSHIGWGLNERASWIPTTELDSRSYCGSAMFSTGPNTEFGGDNDTLCHIDIPMRDCTVQVDGETVVDHGRIVRASLAPPAVAS
jgi:2,5-dihydroxypyridine 5,6-dioxygenase